MTNPQVSVCIPAYGQPLFLRQAIESIAMQDHTDYEIVITDDSLDDAVEKVCQEWMGRLPLRYIRNSSRLGSPENWNEAIRLARGSYIKILHHDDLLSNATSLTNFVRLLDINPHASFAFCSSQVINEQRTPSWLHVPSAKQLRKLAADPTCLFSNNFVGSPSATIFRREAMPYFDPNLAWDVDWEFYIRVLLQHPTFQFSPYPLICTRAHVASVTSHYLQNPDLQIKELFYVYYKLFVTQNVRDKHSKAISKLVANLGGRSKDELVNLGANPRDAARVSRKAKWNLIIRSLYRFFRGYFT